MRARVLILAVAVAAFASLEASAAENFIARGHSYAPGENTLPPLNSTQDEINKETDLLEAEIYVEQRERKRTDSELSRFINNQELTGPDQSLDY